MPGVIGQRGAAHVAPTEVGPGGRFQVAFDEDHLLGGAGEHPTLLFVPLSRRHPSPDHLGGEPGRLLHIQADLGREP